MKVRRPQQHTLDFELPLCEEQRLTQWPPDVKTLDPSWRSVVTKFFASPTGVALTARLSEALAHGKIIYPPDPLRALALTPLQQVRVVILGQDPYHGQGQAEGLAFSVPMGVKTPPSLRNIHQELAQNHPSAVSGQNTLVGWAKQGVLLLNASLTVEKGQAASHAGWGWEALTDALIRAVANSPQPVVFMLWGAHAQAKAHCVSELGVMERHLVLQANHPSPLSARRPPKPFLGCGHFTLANEFLERWGQKKIEW